MKRVTVAQVLRWDPCPDYEGDRIQRLFGKRKTLGVLDVCALRIPEADRLWALGHMLTKAEKMRVFSVADLPVEVPPYGTLKDDLWICEEHAAVLRAVRTIAEKGGTR